MVYTKAICFQNFVQLGSIYVYKVVSFLKRVFHTTENLIFIYMRESILFTILKVFFTGYIYNNAKEKVTVLYQEKILFDK